MGFIASVVRNLSRVLADNLPEDILAKAHSHPYQDLPASDSLGCPLVLGKFTPESKMLARGLAKSVKALRGGTVRTPGTAILELPRRCTCTGVEVVASCGRKYAYQNPPLGSEALTNRRNLADAPAPLRVRLCGQLEFGPAGSVGASAPADMAAGSCTAPPRPNVARQNG